MPAPCALNPVGDVVEEQDDAVETPRPKIDAYRPAGLAAPIICELSTTSTRSKRARKRTKAKSLVVTAMTWLNTQTD